MIVRARASNNLIPEKTKVLEVELYRGQLLRYLDDYQIKLNNYELNLDKDEHNWGKLIVRAMGELTDNELQRDVTKACKKLGDESVQLVSTY